jgi:uncharacterized protein
VETQVKVLDQVRHQSERGGARSPFDCLIAALREPSCYSHPVRQVDLLETHISCVLLTGDYAYKIKKPVKLGFLDFSSLEARRFYCGEELRLNRRTAPQLYLDVVAVTGTTSAPVVGGAGVAIDYAIKMRQFSQNALFDRIAQRGELVARHIDALAGEVVAFHGRIERADGERPFGSAQGILASAMQNLSQMLELGDTGPECDLLYELRKWTVDQHASLAEIFAARKRDGFVRECHGDLHLGNIALLNGVATPFDCIEFNEDLRWIDVINEIAFLVMDLLNHGLADLAFRLLNAYLENTGDYSGMRAMRFYLVYRALVRAKVRSIRMYQAGIGAEDKARAKQACGDYLKLAQRLTIWPRPALIITHGLAGSGKTTVSQSLLESFGAIRLRSDVERKRLHGLQPGARTSSRVDAGIYAAGSSDQTYAELARLTRELLAAGFPVIVDAGFLSRRRRRAFCQLAIDIHVPFAIASCTASETALRNRIGLRDCAGNDASEAGLAVLDRQLATQEPLASDEIDSAVIFEAERGPWPWVRAMQQLAQRLALTIA